MQRKIFCALFVCATLLLMAPALMAEETADEKAMENAIQVLETVEAQQGERVAPVTLSDRAQQEQAELNALGLPVAPALEAARASLSGNNTCIQCSTHSDCASICGGELYFDYLCMWVPPQTCGSHIKQCYCH